MRLFLKILTAACIISGVVIVGFVLVGLARRIPPQASVQPVQSVDSTPEPATSVSSSLANERNDKEITSGARQMPTPPFLDCYKRDNYECGMGGQVRGHFGF